MNESFFSMTNLGRAVATNSNIMPHEAPFAGLLPDPQHTLEFWKSAYRQMDLERDPKESIASSLRTVIRHKLDKYHKEHGERANVIVLASYYKVFMGKEYTEFNSVPIFYSLNISTTLPEIDSTVLVF